jgi:hypothetical protein
VRSSTGCCGWPGGHRHVWNRPALSLVENMNRAIEHSTGE